MTYTDQIQRLGAASEAKVVEVYRRFVAGHLDQEETVALIAQIIAAANSRAVALADLSLASTLMLELGTPVAVVGVVRPADDPVRLRKAATTVLDVAATSAVPEAIVGRLARSEPLESAANAYSEAISRSDLVQGWVRHVSAGACELCTWWSRDGRVWPKDHVMPTHKGCTCTPRAVVTEQIKSVSRSARAQSEARRAAQEGTPA